MILRDHVANKNFSKAEIGKKIMEVAASGKLIIIIFWCLELSHVAIN